jgi:septum formation protein
LLANAGFDFEVAAADIDETPRPGEPPLEYVLRVAEDKATAAAEAHASDGTVVLAADTVVVVNGELLGKPENGADARRMLERLSDTIHEVHTGVILLSRGRVLREVSTTRVRFAALSRQEIDWYIATGEPDGKAGAYAIQGRGSRFIEWIDGSWSNVVGLPIATVYRMLLQADMVS